MPQGIAPTHQLQPHLPRLTARVIPTLPRISLPSQWRVLGWHGEPLDQLWSWCAWATARDRSYYTRACQADSR